MYSRLDNTGIGRTVLIKPYRTLHAIQCWRAMKMH